MKGRDETVAALYRALAKAIHDRPNDEPIAAILRAFAALLAERDAARAEFDARPRTWGITLYAGHPLVIYGEAREDTDAALAALREAGAER